MWKKKKLASHVEQTGFITRGQKKKLCDGCPSCVGKYKLKKIAKDAHRV